MWGRIFNSHDVTYQEREDAFIAQRLGGLDLENKQDGSDGLLPEGSQ